MKSAIVTGANGFLGRFIVREFASRGWQVIGLGSTDPDVELLSLVRRFGTYRLPDPRFAELLAEFRPRVCVHAAGQASVPRSFSNPAHDFDCGPGLVFHLLDQIRHSSPETRFLYLSSAAVYGNPAALPVREDQRQAPASPYGYHKQLSELICREFYHLFGIHTASLRIFSAYGPGLRKQVVWDLCRKLTEAGDPVLHGTGAESRDFIHGQDVARAVHTVVSEGSMAADVYNVATGIETTIADLAARVASLLSVTTPYRFDGVQPPGNPANWQADVQSLASLGFRPMVALDDGLTEFVSWYRREVFEQCHPRSASG